MTMHAVLGDGQMTRRELTETLGDLWKADEENSQSYWFLLQGKSEPTDTDKALVTWLEKNDIYYELVTDDPDAVSEIYTQPQEVHKAQKIAQKVVALLQSKPEEGEPSEILALFADVNDATAAEDKWLNGVIQAAYDAGFADAGPQRRPGRDRPVGGCGRGRGGARARQGSADEEERRQEGGSATGC